MITENVKRYFIITCFGGDFTRQQLCVACTPTMKTTTNKLDARLLRFPLFFSSSYFRLLFSLPRFRFFFYSHFRFHWNAKNVCTTIMTMICKILRIICASMLVDAHRSLMYLFKIIKHSYAAVIRR